MSERVSQRLALLEAVIVAAPLSLLFLVYGPAAFVLSGAIIPEPWNVANAVVAGCVALALLAGWVLLLSFIRGGVAALSQRGFAWWALAGLGVLVGAASFASNIAPPSPEYTPWWAFRQDFSAFVLGLPLAVVLGHLAIERQRGR